MEPEDVPEDEGPLLPWISPDDRLWRHPSEMGSSVARSAPQPARGARLGGVRIWSVAVVAGVVGAVLASGVGIATGSFEHRTTVLSPITRMVAPADIPLTTASTSADNSSPDWPAIADDIAPSVVAITSSGPDGVQTGSGVLYTSIGDTSYILTAGSLIGDGKLTVTFDDSETEPARVVGVDLETGLGLVSVPGGRRVYPPFIPETGLQVAQPVLDVGAHTTSGGPNVAPGSISALDVAVDSGDDATMENLIDVVSSDPGGEEGAAIVDAQGAVCGIEAPVDSPDADMAGQTFAVPFDVAQHVASQMIAGVRVTHPWLGVIDSKDPSTATADQLSLTGGSQVTQVTPGSPAERAGLVPSDIITAFDGHPVASTGALSTMLSATNPGEVATIAYIQGDQRRSAQVTLADTPSDVSLGVASGG